MQQGKPGVKYGLDLRHKKKPAQQLQQQGLLLQRRGAAPSAAAAAKGKAPLPFGFGDDDDDDEASEAVKVEREIARQAEKKQSQKQTEEAYAAALAEDPTAFAYDEVYDELHASRHSKIVEEHTVRKPKYIGALLEKAKQRERELEIVRERQLAKEREAEDAQYAGKERFVTRAYREKLAERAQWVAEEKRREALEAANDVTKKKDLTDLYRNLYQAREGLQKPQKSKDAGAGPSSVRVGRGEDAAAPSTSPPAPPSTAASAAATVPAHADTDLRRRDAAARSDVAAAAAPPAEGAAEACSERRETAAGTRGDPGSLSAGVPRVGERTGPEERGLNDSKRSSHGDGHRRSSSPCGERLRQGEGGGAKGVHPADVRRGDLPSLPSGPLPRPALEGTASPVAGRLESAAPAAVPGSSLSSSSLTESAKDASSVALASTAAGAAAGAAAAAAAGAGAAVAHVRRASEGAVSAAKERYLARKKQKT